MPNRDEDTLPELERTLAPSLGARAVSDASPDGLGASFAARYRPGEPIGRGGVGQVATAYDVALGREVAVKELLDPRSMSGRVRFEREARLTAHLEHPGIVGIHELGRRPSGELYLVMRKIRGRPLSDAIAEATSLDARLGLLPTLAAVAEAVGYAHQHGVVHRDLKPSNVLLGEHGEAVVVDWGLAKDLNASGDDERTPAPQTPGAPGEGNLTMAGSLLGTPEYMSPEQAHGEAADARSDVYSLGVMLYQAMSGRQPYTGPTPNAVMLALVGGPPEPLAAREGRLPHDLVAIVERAMHANPELRYRTARDLAADLRRFQTGQLVSAHTYSALSLLKRRARKHVALLTVAGVAAFLLLVVAFTGVYRIVAERDRATAESARATRAAMQASRISDFLTRMFKTVHPDAARGREIGVRELLDGAARDVESQLGPSPSCRPS